MKNAAHPPSDPKTPVTEPLGPLLKPPGSLVDAVVPVVLIVHLYVTRRTLLTIISKNKFDLFSVVFASRRLSSLILPLRSFYII